MICLISIAFHVSEPPTEEHISLFGPFHSSFHDTDPRLSASDCRESQSKRDMIVQSSLKKKIDQGADCT